MKKTAVILFNLGGPNSKESIELFLFNFFMDKNIVRLPLPLRYLVAKKISMSRSKKEANDSYRLLGYKSPLLENSNAQAKKIQNALGKNFKTFVCMRYWHPMAEDIVRDVKNYAPDKIVLLPLYPQFSTTTTRSSLQTWKNAARRAGLDIQTKEICCYPLNDGFIKACAENIKVIYETAHKEGHSNIRLLFSAHGLPKKIVKDGDPYQWQCEYSAEKIANHLSIILKDFNPEGAKIDWQICYQSRVGRLKWIGPSLDEALEQAARDRKTVVIYPHAFTQEHVETLVELDIEYKRKAKELGLPGYYRVQTVGTHAAFIDGLASIVRAHVDSARISSECGGVICPSSFGHCYARQYG